jgi:hypothetical protein
MKLIPEDQLLTAPGLDREKIKLVAISIGVGGVCGDGVLLSIVFVCSKVMVDGVGGG